MKSLSEITHPIQNDLTVFRDFFREQTDTDIFLLNKVMRYLLRQKGKEIRPTLVFMTARMFGDVDRRSYIAATMIELLHTATLIHDDVVDEADIRRGFLSINKLWNNKAGVLLGDFLLSKGLLIALDNKEYDMLQILSGAVKQMSEGELRQLKTARLFNMTEERYFQIISEKTASLISACCECGASAATDNQQTIRAMKEIGLKIGIAFQIKDDLFDYGLDDVGKPKRNDIQERKVTLPLIKAFENSSTMETLRIKRLMRKRKKSSKDVDRIVEFVHQKNGLHSARLSMEQYAEEALEKLSSLPVQKGADDFQALVEFIINRKK
ncbi:polyprenyl synthetase family protein [Rhodohalobacter sp. SW132]|uniref:polyprenyl synthetase family protein n=1 Tax=Rhodohalobacter sp. SW132 TaxID=2293433 RepID=UPI001F198C2C|nr:polyprenyl synthetase family protein [Rhodohalobacter sp. SW132]